MFHMLYVCDHEQNQALAGFWLRGCYAVVTWLVPLEVPRLRGCYVVGTVSSAIDTWPLRGSHPWLHGSGMLLTIRMAMRDHIRIPLISC